MRRSLGSHAALHVQDLLQWQKTYDAGQSKDKH